MPDFNASVHRAPWWRVLTVLAMAGLPVLIAAGKPGSEDQAAIDRLRYGPGVTNHPVGVVPSDAVNVPADWPLGTDGTFTCLTCHYKLSPMTGGSNPCLRGPVSEGGAARDFCAKCHAVLDNRGAAGMHWMAVGVAHVKPDACDSAASPSGALDAETRRCLGCHDGVNAGESANPTASSPQRFWDLRRNHPVGVSYADRGRGKAATLLRSSQLLPGRVRLPDGKVSCVSCHDLFQTGRHRLSVSMEESKLCLTCHDKK